MNEHHRRILLFFSSAHLPEDLRQVSRKFEDLAIDLVALDLDGLDLDGIELSVALRKLLESRDAAVRAALSPAPSSALRSALDAD